MKPPVLVVCFRRPRNLRQIIEVCKDKSRDIFIFIDRNDSDDELNAEVCRVANSYHLNTERIKVKISETNLGVRHAVPTAINWALESCDSLIVLEDDCIPNEFALKYFDDCLNFINGATVMISGSTLTNFPQELKGYLYESEFPLIWGWALTKWSWEKIRPDRLIKFKDVARGLIKNPKNLIPILYFYAAVIRINSGLLQAWDSPVALKMLIENYKSVVPDYSVISNIGNDEVASHFELTTSRPEATVTTFGDQLPAKVKNLNRTLSSKLNEEIKMQIYQMKLRHILSPLKSIMVSVIQR